ncbi:MAG TPA: hypothetical protein VHQ41_00175 [Patescibacteria group bacterium]|jgi:CheY-like chemotaxis protein|nr:hypothetical protein [Patescibacteria group bacterium]
MTIQNPSLPKVIIVEDNDRSQSLFVNELSPMVYVVVAETVGEAFAAIDRNPDALLLAVDDGLPHQGDGVEVVKFAKDRGFPNPIVAISNRSNADLIKAGATDEVDKLYAVGFLEAMINDILVAV